ncbi:Tubulin beta-2 chain [Portunus trituberculatus]|uniref:Tubulin beta-2 chain n=1 Tax=Portunus trituberculatus TaxID=210409 RepID=A0A5B7GJN3_PORTR|nr:Tubulin beta-2 chain [Portunus trituberculatus]
MDSVRSGPFGQLFRPDNFVFVWKGSRERSLGRDEGGKVLAGWSAGRAALLVQPSLLLNTGMVNLGCHSSVSSEPGAPLPTRQGRDSRRCHYWQSEIYV